MNYSARSLGLLLLLCLALLLLATIFAVTRPLWFGSATALVTEGAEVSPQRLREDVFKLSEGWPSRSFRQPQVLDEISEFIHQRFSRYSERVWYQPFEVGGSVFRNVVAEFGPADGELVVIGAHYDTFGFLPGADDNASGVAGVLELAHLLAQTPPPKRTMLVAFTLEEPPFFGTDAMGSSYFADALKEQEADVRIMISLEMIGYFSDEPGSQEYPLRLMKLFYPDVGNGIFVVDHLFSNNAYRLKQVLRQTTPLPVHSINAPWFIAGVDFSDHRNFWYQDYPAVMVTDTAFYRNKAYHTPQDTADRLDYERMAEVITGVYYWLLSGA